MKDIEKYTIETEDLNRREVHRIIADCGLNGYSLYEKQGCWKGSVEKSISIVFLDINHKPNFSNQIHIVAVLIKQLNKQETVFVEKKWVRLDVI